jgi:hypothetical protein
MAAMTGYATSFLIMAGISLAALPLLFLLRDDHAKAKPAVSSSP